MTLCDEDDDVFVSVSLCTIYRHLVLDSLPTAMRLNQTRTEATAKVGTITFHSRIVTFINMTTLKIQLQSLND